MKHVTHTQHTVPDEPDGSVFLAQEIVSIETLIPHPRNARVGDVGVLVESVGRHGQLKPLVVQQSTRHVLCGNHLLAAAQELGMTEVAVVFVDVDDEQAIQILLIDNKSTDNAGYDDGKLLQLLSTLPSFEGTGFDRSDLERLLAETGDLSAQAVVADLTGDEDDGETDVDEDGDEADAGRSRRSSSSHRLVVGEVVALGEHRLVCGDRRDPHAWERLLGGEPASLLIADARPAEESSSRDRAAGSSRSREFLDAFFAVADDHLAEGGAVLVFRGAEASGVDTLAAISDRWTVVQELVYLYGRPESAADLPFVPAHAQIVLARKSAADPSAMTRREGGTSVWSEFGDGEADFPSLAVLASALAGISDQRAVVVDAAAAHASTLLACRAVNRIAHLLQPDPAICEQILASWEEASGEPPRRVS